MKINRSYIRKVRYAVQWATFCMVIYAGYCFSVFAGDLAKGVLPSIVRPPSVEGFMPIGALMSLKLWIAEGVFDPVHPAALTLFIGAILLAVILKKSFCSWICPVGALSEAVWKCGAKLFGKNFTLPRYIDYPLRSIKYLLTAFFVYIIVVKMSPSDIRSFLDTPYWKVSDIKLLKFFTEMSLTTQGTLLALSALSLLYKNFWCRYLCPYGGFLGILSMLSPVKIRRDEKACIHCGLCAKNCPALLPVDKEKTVRSPECSGCLTCVSHCPAKGALNEAFLGRRTVEPTVYAALVVGVFFGLILLSHLTGHWHSSVSPEELRSLVPVVDNLTHP